MTIKLSIYAAFLLAAVFGFSVFALSKILHNCKTQIGKITVFLMIFIFAALSISLSCSTAYMMWFAAQ